MKIPLSWLADFMEINNSVDEYVDMLNQLGFEVEGVESPGDDIRGVIIAKVLETHPHPDADKLKLVDIDTGTEQKQIVCGAPNVRAGLTVPYAPSGSTLPGGFKLEARKIRGIVSDGMLCSTRELNLGEDHDGIMELNEDLVAGSDAVKSLGLDDTIIELSITPNRPDAMSIVGIARELCAAFNQELKLPDVTSFLEGIEITRDIPEAQVEVLDEQKCPRFVGRTMSVQVGPSPEWMSNRLQKCDQKSINNVVDVTNYVMLEWGRPLHAFDLDHFGTNKIIVRRASQGESVTLLDDTERTLVEDDLVIATDDGNARGVAGVMGGLDSGIYNTTKNVYLESAYFAADSVSKTSKRLGLRSEASSRFERGVDPNFVEYGSHRACQLLAQVANAKISESQVDFYPTAIEPAEINLRASQVGRILGDNISVEDIKTFLDPLVEKIEIEGKNVKVWAPTYRPDLTREIDLIEEVARKRGLNSFEPTLPNSLVQVGGLNENQKKRRIVEDALVGAGLFEAYTLPLEAIETYQPFGFEKDDLVKTKNALKSDASILRPIIIPGLLRSVQRNEARGISDVQLFETGNVFNLPFDENLQPKENCHVGAVLSGSIDSRPQGIIRNVDVFDAVDLVNIIASTLRLSQPELREISNSKGFHPTRCNDLYIDGTKVGVVGELLGENSPVGFEINLDVLFECKEIDSTYKPSSNYPFVAFDLAFVVDSLVSVQELKSSIEIHGGQELEHISFFDIFEGGSIGLGKKSLAFSLRVRPSVSTWKEEDQTQFRQKIIDGVAKDCKATLRS